MPDRWRNAGGSSGGVLEDSGGCSLCRYVRYIVMERTEAFPKQGTEGVSVNRKDGV